MDGMRPSLLIFACLTEWHCMTLCTCIILIVNLPPEKEGMNQFMREKKINKWNNITSQMIYHPWASLSEQWMHCWFNVMAHKPWITAVFVTVRCSMSMVSNTDSIICMSVTDSIICRYWLETSHSQWLIAKPWHPIICKLAIWWFNNLIGANTAL